MADVLQKVIPSNAFQNGSVMVSISTVGSGQITDNVIRPDVNQFSFITTHSGILDTRFDDIGYYFGGSG